METEGRGHKSSVLLMCNDYSDCLMTAQGKKILFMFILLIIHLQYLYWVLWILPLETAKYT